MKRLWLEVDPRWTDTIRRSTRPEIEQRAVEQEVARMLSVIGWPSPTLVVQDPSDPTKFTALVTGPQQSTGAANVLRVVNVEEVEPSPISALVDVKSLDAGTTRDVLEAVKYALVHEHDPMRLEGFACTLEEDYPVLASLVYNLSQFEALARKTNAKPDVHFGGPERITHMLDRASRGLRVDGIFKRYAGVASRVQRSADTALAPIPEGVAVTPEDFGAAVARLVRDPLLLSSAPTDAADMAARSAVQRIDGFGVVDPARARHYMPMGPTRIASSAIKAAHGSMRPTVGQIANVPSLANRLDQMRSEDGAAQASMDRARRLLDRWNWIEWYKRHENAKSYR